MSDVTIGSGTHAGKGVYAGRDFDEGERVLAYNLQELSQAEFDALPDSEREWTHSFGGKIYLFPTLARYVNHSDDPSTLPDHTRNGNYALRPIKRCEAITIDNNVELQHELDTFLAAYETAANSRDFAKVESFIAADATFWFTNGHFEGRVAIRRAFEDTWQNIQDESYTISNVQWIARNYWVSSCTYEFTSDGHVDGKRQVYKGHGTNVFVRRDGSWRIMHEHLSK